MHIFGEVNLNVFSKYPKKVQSKLIRRIRIEKIVIQKEILLTIILK